ncbi:chromosome segregation protein [Desulfocucumis palustris]|uniref:Chromosome segregation protein n=1 Tax=Desulfocucumis palustris TaxID=1898651 RepID=A0A2L2XAC6_9FIRM|nr:SbcC/MukB-like Walker B domain-containing protein [Desulfocucumis palustris]GBF32914.1 chromosome segregation protein [Desulfocucumis palustris]
MKLLKKLLLINWHYFRYQLVELDKINFLTGVNASGKSTLIDALQLLLLGDTAGSFFNKAANEKSRRSLRGYLRGEVAENDEEGPVYLRTGNFTSYIAAEFEDTSKSRLFCLGVVFDCHASGDYNHRFFALDHGLPENHFIQRRIPLSFDKLKDLLYEKYGRQNVEFFDSNLRYREVLRGRMGNISEKFFRLFRKAVPFSPIMDIKGFISEFVCDIGGRLDVEDMMENIRYYKQLESEMETVKKRINALGAVSGCYRVYQEERQKLETQRYIIHRGQMEQDLAEIRACRKESARLEAKICKFNDEQLKAEQSIKELEEIKEALLGEKNSSDAAGLERQLKGEKDRLQVQVEIRKKNRDRIKKTLFNTWAVWDSLVRELGEAGVDRPDVSPLLPGLKLVKEVAGGTAGLPGREDLEAICKSMDFFRGELSDAYSALKEEVARISHRAAQLEAEINELEKGAKPYSRQLGGLIEAIAGEIKKSAGLNAPPRVFADLMEIKDEKWRNAIEGYLHTQKFHLLVDPEFFDCALGVYDRLKFQREFYDLGIVDVARIMSRKPAVLPGSLAEEIAATDSFARAYADLLLGRVIKCENAGELRRFETAVTPSGMLYQRFVARQINPARYRQPYIGREALAEQARLKREEWTALKKRLSQLQPRLHLFGRLRELQGLSANDINNLLEWWGTLADLPQLERKLQQCIDRYGSLDLEDPGRVDGKIEETAARIRETNKLRDGLIRERGRAESRLENINGEAIPRLEELCRQKQMEIDRFYSRQWQEEEGEGLFLRETGGKPKLNEIIERYSALAEETAGLEGLRRDELLRLRGDYNRDYKSSLDISQEHNRDWENEAVRLEETRLTAYEAKIKKAREKAQLQFQEDFVSKLRENIETVERQLFELNLALKGVPFGRDRYRFSVTPNRHYRRYYDMIMSDLLIQGHNVFSEEFQSLYRDVVEELFSQIVDTGKGELTPEKRVEMERNLEHFTDFRAYLDFDLIVSDDQGNESRLSRIISKKSGGETQTPFYISVLASFIQIYRIKQQGFNNTLRLIVFDEAYSKMDHQRIRESIRLIRDLELQVIISAPTEKIADIAPLVDRNLCITRVGKESFVRAFDPRKADEEGA